MMTIIKRIKFQYLFSFGLLIVLSAALFVFYSDEQTRNLIIGALVMNFGQITGSFFPKKHEDI
ncbi:hypothetical protein [Peribacillus frigoritolerans]|uniref:hypothetical protein n=1 Tax=Peribacillus frigoritolerans TaxID=450367 RepID=UPI002B24E573|nr:hypothetical protein [Peribacillus frigoritolerans]MEB2631513.1 hypothetical protein [Peribacillus frigoritolerans]